MVRKKVRTPKGKEKGKNSILTLKKNHAVRKKVRARSLLLKENSHGKYKVKTQFYFSKTQTNKQNQINKETIKQTNKHKQSKKKGKSPILLKKKSHDK